MIREMAVKNILRQKRRTLLTFLILTVGIAIYIWFTGIMKGFDDLSAENLIKFETGDFNIQSGAYDPDRPYALDNLMKDPDAVLKIVNGKPYVKAATRRLAFQADLDNTRVSTPVIVMGVDPAGENTVFQMSNFIREGKLEKGGAVMGYGLVKDFKTGIGDTVYLTFRNEQGMFDSVEVTVSGIIHSPNPVVNNTTVYVTLPDAQKYINTTKVTEIVLKTADHRQYKVYDPDLRASLSGKKIRNWKKMADDFGALGQAKSKSIGLILFFVAIIAAVGIINTMMMSVYEKRTEIGTLKALGMTDRDVRRLFVTEGMIIGFIGSFCGVILGAAVNLIFVIWGFDITSMVGNMDFGYRVLGVVYARWDVKSMFGAFALGVVISALASFYPANKTVKMQAMECLRTVQ